MRQPCFISALTTFKMSHFLAPKMSRKITIFEQKYEQNWENHQKCWHLVKAVLKTGRFSQIAYFWDTIMLEV